VSWSEAESLVAVQRVGNDVSHGVAQAGDEQRRIIGREGRVGVSDEQAASQEDEGGNPLPTVPIATGTYTVLASFPGSADYLSANNSLTFTISPATPTVVATDAGGAFTGQPFPATATATGVTGAAVNGTFAFTYYVGSGVNGSGTSTPPISVGTYTVVATFASADSNYNGNQSAPVTFVIASIGVSSPSAAMLNENWSLTFSSANGNAITLTDTNAGTSKTESLTLSVAHGSLALGSTTGLSFKAGKNKSASFTVTGTLASLNAALSGLTYTPTTAYWGADSLAITVQDAGDGLSASKNVGITVTGHRRLKLVRSDASGAVALRRTHLADGQRRRELRNSGPSTRSLG
jgi:large repetitive protein